MIYHGDYDRIMSDYQGGGAEVALVVRTADGETTAAVLHNANVTIETVDDYHIGSWDEKQTAISSVVHQARITSISGITMYDPTHFNLKGV